MTLTGAGTPHATLVAIIWLSVAGAMILGPSYALLLTLQGRLVPQTGDEEADFPGRPGSRGGRDRRTNYRTQHTGRAYGSVPPTTYAAVRGN